MHSSPLIIRKRTAVISPSNQLDLAFSVPRICDYGDGETLLLSEPQTHETELIDITYLPCPASNAELE